MKDKVMMKGAKGIFLFVCISSEHSSLLKEKQSRKVFRHSSNLSLQILQRFAFPAKQQVYDKALESSQNFRNFSLFSDIFPWWKLLIRLKSLREKFKWITKIWWKWIIVEILQNAPRGAFSEKSARLIIKFSSHEPFHLEFVLFPAQKNFSLLRFWRNSCNFPSIPWKAIFTH